MPTRAEELAELVRSPRESLGTEIKSWIDPRTEAGTGKVAKACMALYNNNGGTLLVGFDNRGQPCGPAEFDVPTAFHADVIQGIVGKYSSKQFEIVVDFVEVGGVSYPAVSIPSGVNSPAVAKKELADPEDVAKPLIRKSAVYVRTTSSNNTVSTSIAGPDDYDRLVKTCFDNKEADFGGFVRRQLSGLTGAEARSALSDFFESSRPALTATETAVAFLNEGKSRFEEASRRRNLTFPNNETLPNLATRECAAVLIGDVPRHTATEDFLRLLQFSKPRHSGWPAWVDASGAQEPADRSYTFSNAWETMLVELGEQTWFGEHIDFWRIEPTGRFYYLTGLQEDMRHPRANNPHRGSFVDFLLQTSRVAEALSVVTSFARSMGCDEHQTQVAVAFRWAGIRGRHLTSWAEPQRSFYSRGESHDDTITTSVIVPLETSRSGLVPFVEQCVAPLFAAFGGMTFQSGVLAEISATTLERQM